MAGRGRKGTAKMNDLSKRTGTVGAPTGMSVCPNCGRDPKQTNDKLFREWYQGGLKTCPACIRRMLGPKEASKPKPRCPACNGKTGAPGVTCGKCQALNQEPQQLFQLDGGNKDEEQISDL